MPNAMRSDLLLFHVTAMLVSAGAGAASVAVADIATDVFGVRLSVLLAGFAGSVAALTFLPPITSRGKMFSVVVTGTLAAAYSVRLVGHWLGLGEEYFGALAFFGGLCAHLALTWAFVNLPAIASKRFGGGA